MPQSFLEMDWPAGCAYSLIGDGIGKGPHATQVSFAFCVPAACLQTKQQDSLHTFHHQNEIKCRQAYRDYTQVLAWSRVVTLDLTSAFNLRVAWE